MEESEIIRLVRETIRQEITQILMGRIVSTESSQRVTIRRYSNEMPINEVRNILPYGIASRPPNEMDCLTVPIAGDASHINVVGQFDQNRPDVQPGEVCIYGPSGQTLWFGTDGNVRGGSRSAASPMVLGDILQTLIVNILKAILDAPQVGTCAVGPVMLDPSIRTKLTQELSTHVNDPSTNFLAGKYFVQRS